MKTLPDPAVFIEAASLVDEGVYRYACSAITHVSGKGFPGPEEALFVEWFRPDGVHHNMPWFGYEEGQGLRVLALLFGAAIAETESVTTPTD